MKKAQNLIEFVFVFPILIVMILGILEYAIFWKTAHNVQEIAEATGANAANATITNAMAGTDPSNTATFNAGALSALNILQNKVKGLGEKNLTYTTTIVNDSSWSQKYTPPYALYKFDSNEQRTTSDGNFPIITLYVDYRKPYENGIVTQLIYQYRTVFTGVSFPLPNGKAVTLIPKDFEISSTKVYHFSQY